MWSCFQFEAYLNKNCEKLVSETFNNGPFKDKIMPQIKKGVIASILSCKDSIFQQEHHSGHEIFGYDFMVDTNLNVWLLEVNSSPSMEYSSPVTAQMVPEVLNTIIEITT